jgi:hypothetical protein
MKKVWLCVTAFLLLIAYSVVCEFYVVNTIKKTTVFLENAAVSRENGDYNASREYVDAAQRKWLEIVGKSNFLLIDLTAVSDVSVSLSRVATLVEGENTDRFREENRVAILLLRHFLSDNQSG